MGFNHVIIGMWLAFTLTAIICGVAEGDRLGSSEGDRVVLTLDANGERPPGVMWVVQLSDLHLSKYHKERTEALQKIMGTVLGTIQPTIVIISGDLIDAKRKGGLSTQQYEEEWITYQETTDIISKESGIPLDLFYDLRGNHDTFGVPDRSLDYFSRYSISGRLKRTGPVQSVTFLDSSGWKNMIVGVDLTTGVGLRSPSNMFGHASDSLLAKLDDELSQWDGDTSEPVTKLVFGHYPTSFTASSKSGDRIQKSLGKNNVSAYVCGHLHFQFGRQLYKYHEAQDEKAIGDFWEWETGDWRVSRAMRILAMDHGQMSFVDVDLSQGSEDVLSGKEFSMPTVILPTSPLDSRVMSRSSNNPGKTNAGAVRALVFSKSPPDSVIASVFDSVKSSSGDFEHVLVEALKMNLVSGSSTERKSGSYFYELQWDSQKYIDSSATRYWLQIEVFHKDVSTLSNMWPFSVEGKRGPFALKTMAHIVMGIDWEKLYPVLIFIIISSILAFLILPRVAFLHFEKTGVFESWTSSIFSPSSDRWFPLLELPLWALVAGACNTYLWWCQLFYIFALLALPWFCGQVLADGYALGYMTMWGWTVWPTRGSYVRQTGLGYPDNMNTTIPFLGAMVVPLVLMISALGAEQVACEMSESNFQNSKRSLKKKIDPLTSNGVHSKTDSGIHLNGDFVSEDMKSLLGTQEGNSQESVREGEDMEEVKEKGVNWRIIRKAYFVACLALASVHMNLCFKLANSYGPLTVFLSPVYVWAVPTLLLTAVIKTSSVTPKLHVN